MNRLIWAFLGLLFLPLSAQQTKTFVSPRVGISSMPEGLESEWMSDLVSREAPNFLSKPDKRYMYEQKEKSAALFPRKTGPKWAEKSLVPQPILGTAFQGNVFSSSVPMDNSLAFNEDSLLVSAINTTIRVYSRNTGMLRSSMTLRYFTDAVGLIGTANYRYDPKVIFDPLAQRFMAVILNGSVSATSKIILAFSQSSDPRGDWNMYTLPGNPFNDSTWFDFPCISFTENEVFITGNQIREGVSWQMGFRQSVIWQIRKQEGYTGDSLNSQVWSGIEYAGRPLRNLHAVTRCADFTGNPEQYFLSNRNFDVQNDSLFLLKISDTLGAGALSVQHISLPLAYGVPPEARQPDTSKTLATNDARILAANLDRGRIQFVGNTIDTATGSCGIYIGQLAQLNQSNPLVEHAKIIGFDTLDLGYANLVTVGYAPDNSPRTIVAFNHSGPSTFPGISALTFDQGQVSDLIRVKNGLQSLNVIQGASERWGDYFGAQQYFPEYGKIWIAGTFGAADKRHSTWIAELISPFGSSPAGVQPNAPNAPATTLFPNPSFERSYIRFSLPESAALKLELFDMNGKSMGVVFQGMGLKGEQEIGFEIGHLPPANYLLVLSLPQGKTTKTIIKQ
ncbi:MAG: T9SS type A sorting domain-containing protein [Bacteroidia bacterium]|jgi:hypothetical protein